MRALVLIDIQNGFDDPKWGQRNNPRAEQNAAALLHYWREKRRPVFHVRHDSTEADSPLRPDRPGNELKEIVQPLPDEPVLGKNVNSAFIGTTLEADLRSRGITGIVLAGLTSPHCVSTSARMAANLGFQVTVVGDATAAYEWTAHDGRLISAADMHFYALAAINREFATIVDTATLLEGK